MKSFTLYTANFNTHTVLTFSVQNFKYTEYIYTAFNNHISTGLSRVKKATKLAVCASG